LERWADSLLRPAWEAGDPHAVAEAMAGFRQAHQAELLDLSEVPRLQSDTLRSAAYHSALGAMKVMSGRKAAAAQKRPWPQTVKKKAVTPPVAK
jgi:hypothetical protein